MSFDWTSVPSPRQLSRTALEAMRDAGDALARQGSAGADYAIALGGDVVERSRLASRATRDLIRENPAQAVVLVAAAAFALGWLMRRMRESSSTPAASPARSRTRSTSRRAR